MAWAILSDDLHQNGKILSFSHAAFRLYVCSITYSRAHRTKGFLTKVQANALARLQAVPAAKTIAELVAKRGWDEVSGGYQIHGYDDIYSKDLGAAERMQRYRNRTVTQPVTERNGSRNEARNEIRNVQEEEYPNPNPSSVGTPLPPAERGDALHASPRSTATNPRARGTNPRAVGERASRIELNAGRPDNPGTIKSDADLSYFEEPPEPVDEAELRAIHEHLENLGGNPLKPMEPETVEQRRDRLRAQRRALAAKPPET